MSTSETERLLNEHLAAWRAGDIDAVIDGFGPGGILVNSGGAITDREEMRKSYEEIFTKYFPDDVRATVDFDSKRVVQDDVAFVEWSAGIAEYAADSIVMRDGKKYVHTFSAVYR